MTIDPILTAAEVAKDLRISKSQAYNLINGEVEGVKQLPHLRVGRRRIVTRSALERWKLENMTTSGILPAESEKDTRTHSKEIM